MSRHFRPWTIDQTQLLPAAVVDYVPANHLAQFVVALARALGCVGDRRKLQKRAWSAAVRSAHGIVKANEYSRFSALNPAERGGNSRAKTVGLQPAMASEEAV